VQPASVSDGTSSGGKEDTPSLTEQWIDFCWQPTPAREISLFSKAASPMLTNVKSAKLREGLQQDSVLLPKPSVFDKSDFLKPLPESAVKEYQALWKEIRASKVAPS
jgi:putative spermidine/putrescine transport system substrate-binding protein